MPFSGGLRFTWACVLLTLAWLSPGPVAGDQPSSPARDDLAGLSVLRGYYQQFLADSDLDAYRQQVTSRFREPDVARMLRRGDVETRRAAVLALGLMGSFEASNSVLGAALRDADAVVRRLAEPALWMIWTRADSPENNRALEAVQDLIQGGRLEDAVAAASRLIAVAPEFAEAYNQRAIAEYALGRLEESIADCERTLERNPWHFGALSGMGQCHMRLGRRAEAAVVFRRAAALRPHDPALAAIAAELEAPGGP
jgi:tetratricopeptide (TPR) repeat protein